MTRLMCAVLVLSASHSARADWPVARGDAGMSGVGTATLPDQLEEIWAFKTGDSIEGAPAVVGDVVYVASMDKHLYAIDAATAALKWKTKLGTMKASPAVKDGRIYVGDLEGKFYAVNAADGVVVWTFETMGEIHAGANFIGADPLVGSHDGTLYRLNRDGKKVWEFKLDGPVNGSAAVAGDRTFVAGCDSLLHCLDVTTGKSQGTIDLGGQAGSTAAVYGDGIYLGTMSNQVLGLNTKAFRKLWEFEAKRKQQPFYSSAAVTDKFVVLGGRDKRVYALDRLTGKEAWSHLTEGNVDASPTIVGTRVYVGSLSRTGEFYVLDSATGKEVQQMIFDSAVSGSVAVGKDCLYVGTDKGTVYKLGKK